jgi:hypothetical protein
MSRRERSTSVPRAESTAGPAATPASGGSAVSGADVTGLLVAWSEGDGAALDGLLPVVYAELRRQARRALRREAAGHTLEPTALVHEAYLKLVDQRPDHGKSLTPLRSTALSRSAGGGRGRRRRRRVAYEKAP